MGDTRERRWWSRRAAWVTVVVVVLAVAVGGVVIHNVRKDRLAVGATRAGEFTMSSPSTSRIVQFRMPNGRLTGQISLGDEGSLEDSGQRIRAPRGGVLATVSWTSADPDEQVARVAGDISGTLSVRSAGTIVPVGRATRSAGTTQRTVALPGDARSVVLVASFAGRSQSVDVVSGARHVGEFATLYSRSARVDDRAPASSVVREQPADPKSPYEWVATLDDQMLLRLPYVHGLGWAKPGREWVVVEDVGYYLRSEAGRWTSGDRRATYEIHGTPRLSVTVNGRAPHTVLRKPHGGGGVLSRDRDEGRYVFGTDRGDALTVRTVLRAPLQRSSGDTGAPKNTTLRIERSDRHPAMLDPEMQR